MQIYAFLFLCVEFIHALVSASVDVLTGGWFGYDFGRDDLQPSVFPVSWTTLAFLTFLAIPATNANLWEIFHYRVKFARWNSSCCCFCETDYSVGFGGKFGVQQDRQDKSALSWNHVEKVEKHESQKGG